MYVTYADDPLWSLGRVRSITRWAAYGLNQPENEEVRSPLGFTLVGDHYAHGARSALNHVFNEDRTFFPDLHPDIPLPLWRIQKSGLTDDTQTSARLNVYGEVVSDSKLIEGYRISLDGDYKVPIAKFFAPPAFRFSELKIHTQEDPSGIWAEELDSGWDRTEERRFTFTEQEADAGEIRDRAYQETKTIRIPYHNDVSIEDIIQYDNGEQYVVTDVTIDHNAGRNRNLILEISRKVDGI